MENAKQEAIKKAYGEYWEQVKDYVDENGWIFHEKGFYQNYKKFVSPFEIGFSKDDDDNIELYSDSFKKTANFYWRPKSLQGIENNNGWVRVDNEADLPKVKEDINKYFNIGTLINSKFYLSKGEYETKEVITSFLEDKITHYQPITPPKPPIY